MPNKTIHFGSVHEAIADINRPWNIEKNLERASGCLNKDRSHGKSWYGLPSLELTKAAIRDGYPEGAQRVEAMTAQLAAHLPRALGHNRQKRRGEFGDELDIHTMLRGAHDKAWTFASRQVRRGSGIVRIAVDICATCKTSADALAWRGVAGLTLANILKRAGYSCEIVAAWAVRNVVGNLDCSGTLTVKPRSSQGDAGLLAATLTLPGFFRTVIFSAIIRTADNEQEIANRSLGYPVPAESRIPCPDKAMQIFVPASVLSEKSALDWLKSAVELMQGAKA